MRKLTFLLTALLLMANGCVISPRRTVGGGTGTGSNSEFSLTASPTTQNVTAGASAVYSISVRPVNGFTGAVSLSATTSASGVVASLDTTTITGGSGSANLTAQTSTTTPSGNITVTVTGTDTSNNVSQSVSVTASVQAAAATASALVPVAGEVTPAGCVNPLAGSGAQRISLPATPGTNGFTASFDATPLRSDIDIALGFFAPTNAVNPALSAQIKFGATGVIEVRDGDVFVPSNIRYQAGEIYHLRLVENLPATTYSVFVTPPGAPEIMLGANLQVPPDQRGVTNLNGWGMLANATDGATLSACRFSLQ